MDATLLQWSGFGVSILAVLISVWTRVETYTSLKRQRRIELAKRIASALVAGQEFKNDLGDSIEVMKKRRDRQPTTLSLPAHLALEETLHRMESDFNTVWKIIGGLEAASVLIEKGQNVSVDEAAIEAKLGRFKQIQVLAKYDAKSLATLDESRISEGQNTD